MPYIATIERRRQLRKTPGFETSINWEDDVDAIAKTRSDEVNARYGVVRLTLDAIAEANAAVANGLNHERDPLPDNKYHGNLVFAERLEKHEQKRIASTLAQACALVPEAKD